ncbi:hypothetical protein M0813_29269 [Anaeramoeba flamelloides]|uniref:Uncharacterized protein n=1 Tax=Anaeramoeba flamelloides TaxID=1746091 RepID=A0ABQ8XQ50_9EUKA|nr:hypothetical protein M0813_29269 [Anaeramoeba flamelloides]
MDQTNEEKSLIYNQPLPPDPNNNFSPQLNQFLPQNNTGYSDEDSNALDFNHEEKKKKKKIKLNNKNLIYFSIGVVLLIIVIVVICVVLHYRGNDYCYGNDYKGKNNPSFLTGYKFKKNKWVYADQSTGDHPNCKSKIFYNGTWPIKATYGDTSLDIRSLSIEEYKCGIIYRNILYTEWICRLKPWSDKGCVYCDCAH